MYSGRRDSIMFKLTERILRAALAEHPLVEGENECELCASTTRLRRVHNLPEILDRFEDEVMPLRLLKDEENHHYVEPAAAAEFRDFVLQEDVTKVLCSGCKTEAKKAARAVFEEERLQPIGEIEMTRLARDAGFTRSDLMAVGLSLFNYTRALEKFHGIKGGQ